MLGCLSEVFSEELCLPRAKLDLKKENFTLKETVMSRFEVFQFKKNSFDLSGGFQNEFHLGEKPILHSPLRSCFATNLTHPSIHLFSFTT